MKKLLVIAVALAAVNAQATRARMTALANSPHLIDTQSVYLNPADVFSLGGDYVTLESGDTVGTTANGGAEGMIVRTMGDAKMGLSLGHDSANASTWGYRSGAGFISQQNPVEFTYGAKSGDMNWAGTLIYSNYNDKAAAAATIEKESSLGLRFGARTGMWDAALSLGLTNTAQINTGNKFTGTMSISAEGGYQMDSVYLFGRLTSSGFKVENNAGTEIEKQSDTAIFLAAMSSMKKDGTEVFYGAGLNSSESKETIGDTKETELTLPLWIGVEADANSWLTLRGSVTQTLQLLNNSKDTTGGTTTSEFAPGANDTTVAMGAGLKFNKVTVDGTLKGLVGGTQNQELDGDDLLAEVGASFWF